MEEKKPSVNKLELEKAELEKLNDQELDNGIDDVKVKYNQSRTRILPSRNFSLLVYAVLIVLAYFLGQQLFSNARDFVEGNLYVFGGVTIILGFIIGVIIYEIGKVVFGLIAGYKFVNINIFGLDFTKTNNKIKFRLASPQNLGASSLMIPKGKKAKTTLYLIGGLLFYIIIAAIVVTLILVLGFTGEIAYGLYISIGVSFVVCIYNLLPFRMDVYNDGYKFRTFLNKANIEVYHDNLNLENYLLNNEGQLENKIYDNYNSVYQVKSLRYKYYYYLKQRDLVKAEKVLDLMIEKKAYLLEEEIEFVYIQKVFYVLCNQNLEDANKYYWNTMPKFCRHPITSTKDLSSFKDAILVCSLLDVNFDEFEHTYSKLDALKNKYKYQTLVEDELYLIELAEKRIKKEHPEWLN